ncbi:MAG: type II toxin-antitoxin system Phd/YefM family antitoxin [Gemmatimonadaceae bacterium]|nr:type II toxin-antitoxin system Phd/YefM family antitoxin [Gemmatimonadaceae bacterium]
MSKPLNIYEAKTRLSELVERAEHGEEIIIARAGKPVARLVPLRVAERRPGRWAGKVWMADDFDVPLPDDVMRQFEGDIEPAAEDDA